MKNEPSQQQNGQSMPYLIPDADFNVKLKIHSKNIEHTKEFLEQGVQDFELPQYNIPVGYRFVKSLKRNQYRLITTTIPFETVYLVEVIFRKDIVYTKTICTQVKVWRTVAAEHSTVTRAIPRAFFNYLLENYNIVVSDEEQTSAGKRFWETMIDWAFKANLYIYISDGTEEERPLIKLNNTDELYEKWEDFCWGKDRDIHTHRLLVISKEPLSQ